VRINIHDRETTIIRSSIVMYFSAVVLMMLLYAMGCDDHHKPHPSPVTPHVSAGYIHNEGGRVFYKGKPVMLHGYGDYGMLGDKRLFPDLSTINSYLSTIASYGVNLTRNFLLGPGPFSPYEFVAGTDFVLTKERAMTVKSWHKYQHAEHWDDQWNDEFWNRLHVLLDHKDMVHILVILDHWHNYRGQNYKTGYARDGVWVGPNNPRALTFWDWAVWNPGNSWSGESPVPLSEMRYTQESRWPPAANDNLLFHDGAIYKDRPDRRRIIGEFIDKMMKETKDYPNVIYEIGNELRDYTSIQQIVGFHTFCANRILSWNPNAYITSSTDANACFHQPYMKMAMVHGLHHARCNAHSIKKWDEWAGRPVLLDDDGCWSSASPGESRADPLFVGACMNAAEQFGYHTNTKQSYDIHNLNIPVLEVIRNHTK